MSSAAPETCPTFPPDAEPSWWQTDAALPELASLDDDADVDVCIVGAGVTGTSAARALARAGAKVLLLDARGVAAGASGRNGGFLLAGLQLRFPDLVNRVGPTRASALHRFSLEARDALMHTAAEIGLGAAVTRTDSLRIATGDDELAELRVEHALLAEHGFESRFLHAEQLPGPLAEHFTGGLRVPGDGQMHPARWVGALAAAAAADGADVRGRSPVISLGTERGSAGGAIAQLLSGKRVRAGAILLCTEAWLPGLLPELGGRVVPYRSQVLAARVGEGPSNLLPMPVWSRRGWDYAQQRPDGVLVVGGEQLEDPDAHATWAETVHGPDARANAEWIRRVLGVEPDVQARWAGVLSRSADGFPYVGAVPGRRHVYVAGGWGGAGNVLGFAGGRLLAGLLTSSDEIPPELRCERLG